MRVDKRVSVSKAVGVPVIVCLHSSCRHVNRGSSTVRFLKLALKVVMQNYVDFVDVILLYSSSSGTPLCALNASSILLTTRRLATLRTDTESYFSVDP